MERELQKLSWLTIQKLVPKDIDTIIFPVGTVEAHGSACIGTDNYIPETIAEGIVERVNALIAPTVNYGITKSLYRYNGGSTIKPSTFKMYIRDILDSFVDSGFKNGILSNCISSQSNNFMRIKNPGIRLKGIPKGVSK